MFKLSVIIVTCNRINLLKQCIFNILNQNTQIDHIYIVNNNSNDGTYNYLKSLKDNKIIPINLSKNIGGAGGFSYGLKYAYEHSNSDLFLIMDDDTMLLKDTIFQLLKKVKLLNGNFGFLCSDVRWWKDKSPSILNIPIVHKEWNKDIKSGLIKVKSASFVSLLINRQSISNIGLPISKMFIWADDVEYTTRISNKIPSYFVPRSTVIHKCAHNSSNESMINAPEHRLFYYRCMFRNRLYIYKKYYSFKYFILKLMYYLFILFTIPFKSKNYRFKRICYTIIGIWNGLFFNPRINFPTKK